jgi:hypothetical protein
MYKKVLAKPTTYEVLSIYCVGVGVGVCEGRCVDLRKYVFAGFCFGFCEFFVEHVESVIEQVNGCVDGE